ncbi:hypothetical protein SAMN05216308_101415 [Nitrosospira sp. Nsp13]|jgi:hypothetical protein|nr:hypothetical protein SAMN05216308_101415 [Nitrosospira sp. Nsp13]
MTVSAAPIVEDLDVIENIGASEISCFVDALENGEGISGWATAFKNIVPLLKIHGLVSMLEKLMRFVPMIRVKCYSDARQYAQAAALYFYGLADSTADFLATFEESLAGSMEFGIGIAG